MIEERLRRGYDAFNRGDFDSAAAMLHPDMEYFPPGGQAPIRGAPAMRAWMEPDAFAEQHVEIDEITIAGDRVLVRQRARNRAAGSGIEMEVTSWSVWTFDEDLRATRLEVFLHHEETEARAAAGLG